jgi:mevalonate kinase
LQSFFIDISRIEENLDTKKGFPLLSGLKNHRLEQTFYSNGKLLLTAEYVVLDGALALALPTKFGQNLVVEKGSNNEIVWKSFDSDGTIWFEDSITFNEIIEQKSGSNPIKNKLISILHQAYLLNNAFTNSEGYSITTCLSFPKSWGLGTSSTLINNIAQWLSIDAFTLLKNSFGGSGYDIACAQHNHPILYQLAEERPVINEVVFKPSFYEQLYFVYLNKKQNSSDAIAAYRKNKKDTGAVNEISVLTHEIIKSKDAVTFASALEKHEEIMNRVLQMHTVKQNLFRDFDGTIKSLGAWGGDFVLVVSNENPESYFRQKGFETIIPYSEMIL